MPIDTASLLRLDPNKTYYLSNTTGEIKEAGVVQWLRCKLGIGGGRTKAAALAEQVKSALLAEASIHGDANLEMQIGNLDTKNSISGRKLRAIASGFAVKLEARRCVEEKAGTQVDILTDGDNVVAPDPESKESLKKLLVYASSSIILDAGELGNRGDDIPAYVQNKFNSQFGVLRLARDFKQAAKSVKNTCPDFPMDEIDGEPVFKLDELHFRIFLLCALDDAGKLDLEHLAEKLSKYQENELQALREQILAVPLANVRDRNAIADFRNAMDDMFYHNHIVQGGADARDRNIEITE